MTLPLALGRASRYEVARTGLQVAVLAPFGVASVIALARLARRVRADLIHTNGLKAHVLGGLAGRMIRVPVVWHLRDFPPPGSSGMVLKRCAGMLPSVVIATSQALVAAMEPAAAGRVLRIYNPVDLDRFRPHGSRDRLRGELGLTEQTPLIGLVAHLTPWKGHDLFLRIARAVLNRVPACRFVVAGGSIYDTDGHAGYRETLQTQLTVLSLGDRVKFLGVRDDMPDVFAALDALVHCPHAPEPFGRSIAEAMAAGTPVVAARCGGIPELVEDGVTGILVPSGDVDGFASAVVRLLSDSALRQQLGVAARQRAEALFDPDAHARRVSDAYHAVLSRRRLIA